MRNKYCNENNRFSLPVQNADGAADFKRTFEMTAGMLIILLLPMYHRLRLVPSIP